MFIELLLSARYCEKHFFNDLLFSVHVIEIMTNSSYCLISQAVYSSLTGSLSYVFLINRKYTDSHLRPGLAGIVHLCNS